MKTIIVYKYNGTTDLIKYETDRQLNSYLMRNIDTIETVEEVEVIDLCPVEVEEAPKEAPKAEVIVKTFIEEFDFLIESGRTDILEQITDWLMANLPKSITKERIISFLEDEEEEDTYPIQQYILSHLIECQVEELATDYGLTIINDNDVAIDWLADEGYCCLNTANNTLKENLAELINHY